MGLREYKTKRDFRQTREPPGQLRPNASGVALSFVVQKHAATRLHYDFRLEMDGVLKSWAVPKGFPTAKGDRRLAVQVEDHPLDYAGFEGIIPEGNYGAGTVIVWDRGTYRASGDDPLGSLENGKLHLFLSGEKLKGEWALVRMRRPVRGDKPEWLLLKSGADVAPFSEKAESTSVISGRTLEQIASARDSKQWQSNRAAAGRENARRPRVQPVADAEPRSKRAAAAREGARKEAPAPLSVPERIELVKQRNFALEVAGCPKARPHFIEPMKALLTRELPRGEEWIYEIKFDGVRAVAVKSGSAVELFSRAEKRMTGKYEGISTALEALAAGQVVLDGEVVALDAQGRSSFQLLQSSESADTPAALFYYVFDILNLEGRDLRQVSLLRRKELAQAVLANAAPRIRFSPAIQADSERVLREMQARGLEGLVAKRRNSIYEAGRRSGAWLKYKWSNEQEFVIGGYTPPQGARSHFGALLVGYHDGDRLLFAAKVGTGFSEAVLAALYERFQSLIRKSCPFANLPEKSGRFAKGMTGTEMRRCTWLEPRLVCQVRFAEWTCDGHLRQPAFLGIREDKDPREVVRERPAE